MNNERIDLTQFEESFGGLLDAVLDGTCTLEDGEGHLHDRMQVIIAELKRCYEQIDSVNQEMLATRARMLSNENVDWEDPLVQEIAAALLMLD